MRAFSFLFLSFFFPNVKTKVDLPKSQPPKDLSHNSGDSVVGDFPEHPVQESWDSMVICLSCLSFGHYYYSETEKEN